MRVLIVNKHGFDLNHPSLSFAVKVNPRNEQATFT